MTQYIQVYTDEANREIMNGRLITKINFANKRRIIMINSWKDIVFRKKIVDKRHTEEYREHQRKKTLEKMKDPVFRKSIIDRIRIKTKRQLEKQSNTMKDKWKNDNEYRQKILEFNKSEEFRKWKSRLRLGKKLSEETKQKIKEKRKTWTTPSKDTKPEKRLQTGLKKAEIEFTKHKNLDGQPDIFIMPNICVFVDGDWTHGNPTKYKPDDKVRYRFLAKDIWKYDEEINKKLESQGYIVLRFWENEIKNNLEKCLEKILLIKNIHDSESGVVG